MKIISIVVFTMLMASSVMADELRVTQNGVRTTYSGELTSINPLVSQPNQVRFTAQSLRITNKVTIVRPTGSAPNWEVYLQLPDGSYVTLQCNGNVPAYIADTFAFDVSCE